MVTRVIVNEIKSATQTKVAAVKVWQRILQDYVVDLKYTKVEKP